MMLLEVYYTLSDFKWQKARSKQEASKKQARSKQEEVKKISSPYTLAATFG